MIKVTALKSEHITERSCDVQHYTLYVETKKENYNVEELSLNDIEYLGNALINYAKKEKEKE